MSDEEKINYTKIAVLSIGQPNSVFVCDDQGFVASAFLEKERPATEADVQEHPFFEVGETMYFVRFLHDLADDMPTVITPVPKSHISSSFSEARMAQQKAGAPSKPPYRFHPEFYRLLS